MRFVFWAAVAMVGYTYLGYMGWLWMRRLWRRQPVQRRPYYPSISVILVVRNEALHVERKLRNLLNLNYPPEKLQLIAVSDGSTDGSNVALAEFARHLPMQVIIEEQPQGKASGLNQALQLAQGEIVVFTDARQTIAEDSVLRLMENFADPGIGCASAELKLGDPVFGESLSGMGLYWKIEKLTRELESASGSVVGATGALYAVRRTLLLPLPPETILDDVFIPMQVARQGRRVVLDSRARIWDVADLGTGREFARKVRTLSGVYQLLQIQPWLLTSVNPVRFEFVSHKLLRLLVPFALCAAYVSSILIPTMPYRMALILQSVFYGLSVWGSLRLRRNPLSRITDAAFTFVLLNAAAAIAFANFVVGRRPAWSR
jgi:poly-beta-1,6-N-acetyl-D-glucosamine synthase